MGEATKESKGYGMRRVVEMSFEAALQRIREALKSEGFGVLTEIDLKEKFKEKLDKDFRNYVILGACNPGFAFEALGSDLDIGLLLPCNVVVYDENGGTVVSVIDPEKAMSVAESANLEPVARQVREKLVRVLDSV